MMIDIMSPEIFITESGDEIPSAELIRNNMHSLSVEVNSENKYACLNFSSRLAMYEFARSLLHESIYGVGGQKEFNPLELEGELEVVDGVRMPADSARVIILYGENP